MALFDDHGGEGERAFFCALALLRPSPPWSLVIGQMPAQRGGVYEEIV